MLGKLPIEERTRGCGYGGCKDAVDVVFDYCQAHLSSLRRGAIDQCPECGLGKDCENDLCNLCLERRFGPAAFGRAGGVTKRLGSTNSGVLMPTLVVDKVPAKSSAVSGTAAALGEGFYVYLLALKGGGWYTSRTGDICGRLAEHLSGRVKATNGRKPRLVWFSMVPTEEQAVVLETQLRRAARGKCRSELSKWASQFVDAVSSVDTTWSG